jgi:hypothetical protein
MATEPAFALGEVPQSSARVNRSVPRSRALPRFIDLALLAVLLWLPPLIYLPYLKHNLPVASHWDERGALEVLLRFHQGSLNPHFFMYPTLYFYCVDLLLQPFSYSNAKAMVVGRTFNLMLIGLTAFIAFAFSRDHLRSRAAGAVAAAFVLGSTVLSGVASYIHPDMLMTAAGTGALYYLVRYFDDGSNRAWQLGMTLIGLSVGCKYTAFVLYLAYFFTEMALSNRNEPSLTADSKINLEGRFSQTACIAAFASLGLLLVLLAMLFPVSRMLDFVAAMRSNLEFKPASYYLDFFRHLRAGLLKIGTLLVGAALLSRVSRRFYGAISLQRLYYGLGIVLLSSALSTPFGLLHPRALLFDLGALARSNLVVSGGHAQWTNYATWLVQREGAFSILLSLLGLAAIAAKMPRRFIIVAVYLALYLLILGSSQLGFVRYLAPILPFFYVGSGVAVVQLWTGSSWTGSPSNPPHSGAFSWKRTMAVVLLSAACIQTGLHIAESRRQGHQTNAFFASYWVARNATTGTAFYAGYAPAIELSEAGVKTTQLTWPSLIGSPMGGRLACGDVLILDKSRAFQYHLYPLHDDSVTMLFDAPDQPDQLVLQRSHCPATHG